jgi:hypothetical protein
MPVVKPYLGLSRDRLTSLINSANDPDRVEGTDFTYGLPNSVVGPNNENTTVTLTPVHGTNYRSPVNVFYNRLSIAVVGDLPYNSIEPAVIPSAPFWIRNVLPEINRALGLNLTADEIVNRLYTSIQSTYELKINGSKSLAWLSSTLEFQAITTPLSRLNNVITSSNLSGFIGTNATLSSEITLNNLDGFDIDVTSINLNSAITTSSLDGFDSDNMVPIQNFFPGSTLSGFNPIEYSLSQFITSTGLDGFDNSEAELSTVTQDVLDGFDPVILMLDDIVSSPDLDGFNSSQSTLDHLLPGNTFSGFSNYDRSISEFIASQLDGFDPVLAQIDSLITSDNLDGFDSVEVTLESVITQTTLDGFDSVTLTLEDVIVESNLDGFDSVTLDINAVITSATLDGFISESVTLGSVVTLTELDGFDPVLLSLDEGLTTDVFDGFDSITLELDDVIVVSSLDGFNPYEVDLDVFITQTVLDGFTSMMLDLDGENGVITSNMLDGFDIAPSV